VSYQAILTKTDKCSQAELARVRTGVEEEMRQRPAAHPEIIVTSSKTGAGIAELRAELAKLAG
jgi:GTP-binding protein